MTDTHLRTGLHYVCEGGHINVVTTLAETLSEDVFKKMVLISDDFVRTSLHYACLGGHAKMVKKLTDILSVEVFKELVLMTDKWDKTSLSYACKHGHSTVVNNLVTTLPVEVVKEMVLLTDKWDKSGLHYACEDGHVSVVTALADLIPKNIFEELTLQRVIGGMTALHFACKCGNGEASSKMVSIILKHLNKRTYKTLIKMHNKSCPHTPIHLACKRNYIDTVTLLIEHMEDIQVFFLTDQYGKVPFMYAERFLVDGVVQKISAKFRGESHEKPLLLSLLCQKDKFGHSSFHVDSCAVDNIKVLNKYKDAFMAHDKTLKQSFSEFSGYQQLNIPFSRAASYHPLTTLGEVGNLSFIQHPYIVFYVDTCWRSFVRYMYYTHVLLYFLFFFALSSFISSHTFTDAKNITQVAPTTGYQPNFSAEVPKFTEASRYMTIFLAILGLLYEINQLWTKGKHYWTPYETYADLVLFIGSLAVALVPLVTGYNIWVHVLGSSFIILAGGQIAWLLTKRPNAGYKFYMLFKVVKNACGFFPVLVIVILTSGLVFHNLLQNQATFHHIGFAIAKATAMSTGELDFGNIFGAANYTNSEVFAYLFFMVFILVMAVCMMNLLTGIAVGDTNTLISQGTLMTFQSVVDLILEYSYMFKNISEYRHKIKIYKLMTKGVWGEFWRHLTGTHHMTKEEIYDSYMLKLEKGYKPVEIDITTSENESIYEEDRILLKQMDTRMKHMADQLSLILTKLKNQHQNTN